MMQIKTKVKKILNLLDLHYPVDAKCYLYHEKPYELLFATILSAQCTDDRVNTITETLFKKYPSLAAFAAAEPEELERDIFSAGFYTVKARHIIGSANMLIDEFDGEVPADIDKLTRLPGVGRKTANLILGHVYGLPAIVVDTHVKRISNKLGLTGAEDPEKIEYALMKILPQDHWIRYNTQIIAHGRTVCTAKNPACNACFLNNLCDFNFKKP